MSTESRQTILSIDRSDPRFESNTGGKIKKSLKSDENSTFFVNFRLNQIQNYSVHIKKVEGDIFSLQIKKKITSAKR